MQNSISLLFYLKKPKDATLPYIWSSSTLYNADEKAKRRIVSKQDCYDVEVTNQSSKLFVQPEPQLGFAIG